MLLAQIRNALRGASKYFSTGTLSRGKPLGYLENPVYAEISRDFSPTLLTFRTL